MARSRALQTALFLLAALVRVGEARANPQPMTAGSNPRPTMDTQVAIAREELLIEIKATEVRVEAAYWLQNHGRETSFQGFVERLGEWLAARARR